MALSSHRNGAAPSAMPVLKGPRHCGHGAVPGCAATIAAVQNIPCAAYLFDRPVIDGTAADLLRVLRRPLGSHAEAVRDDPRALPE